MNTTQHPTYFQPAILSEHRLHQSIADAYAAYGLDAPSKALDVKARLNADVNAVQETADRLATAALEPHSDLDAWHAAALDQMRAAQAREALAHAFGRNFQRHVLASAPQYQALAHDELAAHVAKTVKALEQAAKHLPTGAAALDPEAVIAHDAGKHLHAARAALATLGVATNIYLPLMDQEVPLPLRRVAAIVEFPGAAVEQTEQNLGYEIRTVNSDQLEGTREIRDIAKHITDHGTDATLIAIARGDFPGTRLAFASRDDLVKRRHNLVNAHTRITV